MRVLLAEDHPLMRKAITSLLFQQYEAIESVVRRDEIIDAIVQFQPHAVVLDISLRDQSGLQLLPKVRELYPFLAIVVLTTHSNPVYRAEAIRRGADAYVLKAAAVSELLPAIHMAVASRRSIAGTVRQRA